MKNMMKNIALLGGLLIACGAAHAQVVIDAGHGPTTPGSRSFSGHMEHTYTKHMAQQIGQALQKKGIRVRYTQGTQTLMQRAQTKGDLLVSIHYDSLPQSLLDNGYVHNVKGYSTFVSKKNPHYTKSVHCARYIAWGLTHAKEQPSLVHQLGLGGKAKRPLVDATLGVHQFDDLIVLKHSTQPAVLVELGMWVNKHDEPRLLHPATMAAQAQGIADGVASCVTSK